MSPSPRKVQVSNQTKLLRCSTPAIRTLIHALDAAPLPVKAPPGELSIALMDDAVIARVHAQFFDDPTPTDVITFPGDPDDPDNGGEICISLETALREATKRNLPPSQEIALYLIHGWLHLAGHDDLSPAPRKAMRKAEMEAFRCVEESVIKKITKCVTCS
ncbi:MAG: rRNA maturation RNase YbeY [Verrucomicrobiota bacterium]|nr:rRNA maturation RNase YbeY [Verrucomicrobiota bacterium]